MDFFRNNYSAIFKKVKFKPKSMKNNYLFKISMLCCSLIIFLSFGIAKSEKLSNKILADSLILYATKDTLTVPDKLVLDVKSNIISASAISSYQFKVNYTNSNYQFDSVSILGTASIGGLYQINTSVAGSIQVAWARSSNISSTLPLLKLYFSAIDSGKSNFILSDVYFNSDLVAKIRNKQIVNVYNFGDVDNNKKIQAYDASIDLKYSVGLDPIPLIDPLPWDPWRVKVASVDNMPAITANDASLILKYTVGLITKFPKRGVVLAPGYVTATIENKEIVFRSFEDLGGLNINFTNHFTKLDSPSYVYGNALYALNKSNTLYKIAFAFTNAPANGTILLKVPFKSINNDSIKIELLENTSIRNVVLNIVTGIGNVSKSNFNLYPNPTNDKVYLTDIHNDLIGEKLELIDGLGRLISTRFISNNVEQLDLSTLNSGIYFISIGTEFKRIIKL
jgi:hypothetical protein